MNKFDNTQNFIIEAPDDAPLKFFAVHHFLTPDSHTPDGKIYC